MQNSEKGTTHDTIAIRLYQILNIFNSGNSFTVDELVEEFGVSKRTIQRDLNERFSFLPIQKIDGRYSLESYFLGKLNFKDMKHFAALSGVKELYPELDDDFIRDILNEKVGKAFLVNGHKHENIRHKTDEFDALSLAVLQHKEVHFSYLDKQRVVKPYKLVNTDGVWYLLADEDGTLKTYSLSKLQKLDITEDIFKPSTSFLDTIKSNNSKWFSDESIEVVLEIDVNIAEYFLRRELLPNQKTIEKTDKALIVSTKVAYEDEILRIVRYWMPHIKILSPTQLSDRLKAELSTFLKNY